MVRRSPLGVEFLAASTYGTSRGQSDGAKFPAPCSRTDARVAGVHGNCIVAGPPHCHVLFDHFETPSHVHELCCGYDSMKRSESVGLARSMPRLLPVDYYSEPWRRPWSWSHPSGRPVRGVMLSPVASPAKQCGQVADLDSPACPTSVGLCTNYR